MGFVAGQNIGNYKLVSLLGTGGMGAVYLAERTDDLQMRVALKVLTSSGDSFASQRFLRERHLLARLKHPNIAQIIDGGVTDDQRPWFAMELIEGQTLDRYLDEHALGLEAKLRLFQKICNAVSFAHQNLIIHRDLKPANIMVDAHGEPRLLDFGVAGLVDPDGEQTQTLVGRAFTPQYASPEQMRGEPLNATSDVYALGLIFYEMISGSQPYVLMGQAPREAIALICEKAVTRPSDALTTGSNSESQQLRNKLRGDLDTIAMKALAKTAAERYGSVEQFSQDVDRYLNDQPISARQPTLGYRTVKMIKRYRGAVALASITFVVLVGALVYSLQQQRIAEKERQLAIAESKRAKEQQELAEKSEALLSELSNNFGRGFSHRNKEIGYNLLMKFKEKVDITYANNPESRADFYLKIMKRLKRLGYNSGIQEIMSDFPFEVLDLKPQEKKEDIILSLFKHTKDKNTSQTLLKYFNSTTWNYQSFSRTKLSNLVWTIRTLVKNTSTKSLNFDLPKFFEFIFKNDYHINTKINTLHLLELFPEITNQDQYLISTLEDFYAFNYDDCYIAASGFISISSAMIRVKGVDFLKCELEKVKTAYPCFNSNTRLDIKEMLDYTKYYIAYHEFSNKITHSFLDQILTSEDISNLTTNSDYLQLLFYQTIVHHYLKNKPEKTHHLIELFIDEVTTKKLLNKNQEAYIIIPLSYYYNLTKNYTQTIDLLESALNSSDWHIQSLPEMKACLGRAYYGNGQEEKALQILTNLKNFVDQQDDEFYKYNWNWIDEMNRLLAELEHHPSTASL